MNKLETDDIIICKEIAQKVIAQSIRDYYFYKKKKKLGKISSRNQSDLIQSALGLREWLLTPNFGLWCTILEIDEEVIREGFHKLIKKVDQGERIIEIEEMRKLQ